MLNTIAHWFWHLVAMISVCDMTEPDTVSDDEWAAYKRHTALMVSHDA